MAAKKPVDLSTLTYKELQDKVKELEGRKAMNRFEVLQAVLQAENKPVNPECAKHNPRNIKPEIKNLKAQLAEATDKKARKELRKAVSRLKRETRIYL